MVQKNIEVLVIGAGIGGIAMGVSLKKVGIDFLIVEKAHDVGGTWRDNIYPGSGCDVVSHLYSYSFYPKPDWSRRFALQEEIQSYLRACVDKFGIGRKIRLGTEVLSLVYDDTKKMWEAGLSDGKKLWARFVVSAVGQLNQPFTPACEGRETYTGDAFHSAQWDEAIELEGKTVAVVGSGASAIQFVPQIASKVKQLLLFQRSPNWVIPKSDRKVNSAERNIYKYLPFLLKLRRFVDYWQLERTFAAFLKKSNYGRSWERLSLEAMHSEIKNPELRKLLTPDYPAGCKRILLSNEWYATLAKDNVEVIPHAVKHFHENGIIDGADVSHNVDVVIFATGFRSQDFLAPIDVRGREGISLRETWKPYPVTHRGMVVPGFPNFFMIYGPNSNLGHGSAIFMHECQVNYIRNCIQEVHKQKAATIEPTTTATQKSYGEMDALMDETVWSAGCSSWYKTTDGKVVNNWSSHTVKYWWQTRRLNLNEFKFDADGVK